MAIVIIQNTEGHFEVTSFRSEEEYTQWKLDHGETVIEVSIEDVSRGALIQIVRHINRLLTPAFVSKLKEDPEEKERIKKLYEIGARR